jgi:rRNA-processing protein FCF1
MKQRMKFLKYTCILIFLCLIPALGFAQNKLQAEIITERYFQDFDVKIETPAFSNGNGFTSYDEMMVFLTDLQKKNQNSIEIKFIGESQLGKKIPMVLLSGFSNSKKKIRVLFQGGLHGNEPAGTEALLFLMQQLYTENTYKHLLDSIDLAIIPMANIDGFNKQSRTAANGMDLNRDQTKLLAPETILLKEAFNAFNPHVAVDFHEYNAFRKHYRNMGASGYIGLQDVMFLYSGNLNVPKELRAYTNDLFIENCRLEMDENGLRYHDYFSTKKVDDDIYFVQGASNARSSATAWALNNTVAALIEIRGVKLGLTSLNRRVQTGFLIAKSFLQTSFDNQKEIRAILDGRTSISDSVYVKTEPQKGKSNIEMIDLSSNQIIEAEVLNTDAFRSTSLVSRKRPVAYVIPSEEKEIVDKLKVLGIKVISFRSSVKMELEQFRITQFTRKSKEWEGVYLQTVETAVELMHRSFSNGFHYIPLDQKNGNLLAELLEPEAPNSFVSLGIINADKADILPVYRLMDKFAVLELKLKK